MFEVVLWIFLSLATSSILALASFRYGSWINFSVMAGLGVIANVLASSKILLFPFGLSVPAGIVAYSISFFLTDIINEKHGPEQAKKAVMGSIAAQVMAVVLIWTVLQWPAAPFMTAEQQKAFDIAFNLSPRLFIAGLVAFSLSSYMNIVIFDVMRKKTGARLLWLRSKASTITSVFASNLVFLPLGYFGTGFPILKMIYSHAAVQIAIAVLDTLFLYSVLWYAKRFHYDKA